MRQRRRSPEVTVVTAARLSHTDDITLRQRRYVLTQSVRIACVVLATMLPVPLVWKGVLILGAIGLPWFGVVMANAGPTVSRRRRTAMVERPAEQPMRLALEPGRVIDQD
ncbi:MAG: DUF3099 domain-containing protein [Mycobacteriales bacterium]